MSKELPYFKFEPAEWQMGRINKQPDSVKVTFINLICQYWNDNCEMKLEDALLDFDNEHIATLEKYKIIESDGENIYVKFLDKQFEEILATSKKNSEAGKKSAEARKRKREQALSERSTSVQRPLKSGSTEAQPNSTNKIRVDEIRGNKSKEDKIKENSCARDENIKVEIWPSFDDFWNEYDKKVSRDKSEKKWSALSQKDKEDIMNHIPLYKISQPEKRYRKDPVTFLNNKSWNDEIITANGTKQQSTGKITQDELAEAVQRRYGLNNQQ